MSHRKDVHALVGRVMQAYVDGDIDQAPLAEDAEFFHIRDGLICEQQVFFDTRTLFRGRT